MANEIVVPDDLTREEIVGGIVAYLRREALKEDMRWAKVKRMSVAWMAERVERGDWLRQAAKEAA